MRIIATILFVTFTVMSYSQVVASIDTGADFSAYTSVTSGKLTYAIVDTDTNVQFSKVNYSTADQRLTLDTEEVIESISLFKDGKFYLTNMPVFSPNLRISMKNYEPGSYELHLKVKGKIVPTVLEVEKT